MTSDGLGEMFEGNSADTRAGKFMLVPMGGWAEGPACADTGARTPIGASINSTCASAENLPDNIVFFVCVGFNLNDYYCVILWNSRIIWCNLVWAVWLKMQQNTGWLGIPCVFSPASQHNTSGWAKTRELSKGKSSKQFGAEKPLEALLIGISWYQ